MDVLSAIYQRRSIKAFDPNHKMSDEELQKLLQAAQQAPSSFNLQHTRLIYVKDQTKKKELYDQANQQTQVLEASVVFIVCADMKSWEKNPQRFWEHAPKGVQKFILEMIPPFHHARPYIERDEAIRSGALVSMTLMLAAEEMGYSSCPMIGFDEQKLADCIGLPKDHVIVMMLAVGKKAKEPYPKQDLLPIEEFAKENHF
jgi:nitroreductase